MSKKYQNLLSSIKISDVVLKNRLTASPSRPRRVQGAEPYPTEAMITHYANKARNGASMVVCHALEVPVKIVAQKSFFGQGNRGLVSYRIENGGELATNLENYFVQLTDAVHFYGSKATIGVMANIPRQYDVSGGMPVRAMPGGGGDALKVSEELPADMMDGIAEEFALKAAFLKDLGFDGLFMHMAYRGQILGRFLSPLTNKRKDQYGGSPANRTRFPIMIADRIKQKCGRNFILEVAISGDETYPGGLTLDDTKEYAKLFTGHYDILQLRAGDMDPAHPTSFNPERTPFLYMAEAVKKSGAGIAVEAIGGYLDLDICEDVIASGKTDLIAMARTWISNPDYGIKAYEGRGEDVVPCLRCNKCHGNPCSVNPIYGFEHKIERMISPPTVKKKVAVVGGGPAGMEAALVAAGRGHEVTLYEKSNALGGLLKTAENVSFKWTLKEFKNYLVRQIEKSKVKVCLNTEATADMLKNEEYDAVIAAVGAAPVLPDIPGVNGKNVLFAHDVYGKEDQLARNVVVIGGGETGVETGMHLAEKGHSVTVLEMGDMLAPKATPVHYYSMFKAAWEKLPGFKFIINARATGIKADEVIYIDAENKEQSIPAGSVVIAVGYEPKNDLAMTFGRVGDRFLIAGDCNEVGCVQTVIRSAFSNASTI